ncbi:hypothetical protein JYU16_00700 [bacterium AH-315-M05]|nr:hypothetical protein [bacterium AH-315-M05]
MTVKMSIPQIKMISTRMKKFDEELQCIINETSTGTSRQHLANAVIFLKKAIEELDNSVNRSGGRSSATNPSGLQ